MQRTQGQKTAAAEYNGEGHDVSECDDRSASWSRACSSRSVQLGRDNRGDADRAQDLFHRPSSRRPRMSAWCGRQLKELPVVAMVSELVGSENLP